MKKKDLSHIPGKYSLFPWSNALEFFKDYHGLKKRKKEMFGDIFKSDFFGRPMINILDKEVAHFALVEHSKDFGSQEAWELVLKELFPNGLMLMDGERHKHHRSIVAEAFKKAPMEGYLETMKSVIADFLANLDDNHPKLFPLFKAFTLELALKVFFGLERDERFEKINHAIIHIVEASSALPIKLPFTKYSKGIEARKYLIKVFAELIPQKRANPQKDLFSKLCIAENEEGEKLTDEQIIDHLIFILMAAHDTTASTLTSFSYFLAKHTDWKDKLRNEAKNFYEKHGNDFKVRDLRELELTGLALKETLRRYPPLVTLGRVSNRELEYKNHRLPKGTHVSIDIDENHHNPEVWSCPHQFDPQRFSKERSEHTKCPYTYIPFGAGIHHCIGFAFAEMQIKLVMSNLLLTHDWSVSADYKIPMKPVPLQEPMDGLPVEMKRL